MKKRSLFTLFFSIFAAMIFSGYAISRAIIMPIMGGLSDKDGRRIFIASGLVLLAVISLLYLPAHTEYTLTAVRLLNGLAAGMIIPVALAYAGEVAQEGKEGKTMGIFNRRSNR